MTSLDRPVVPEVGISTARSSGPTPVSASSAALPGSAPPTSSSQSSTLSPGCSATAASISGRSPASLIRARGEVCRTSPASSAGVLRGLTDTMTAPSEGSASQHIRYSGVDLAVTITRSPRPTPASRRARVTPATRSAAWPKVSVISSVRSQTPSGSRSAAAASSRGIVPEYSAGLSWLRRYVARACQPGARCRLLLAGHPESAEQFAGARDDLVSVELNVGHELVVGQAWHAVFQVEPGGSQGAEVGGDLLRHGFW